MGKELSLVNSRHVYGPEDENEQAYVYTPTSLWTAGARVLHAGGTIADVQDANLHPLRETPSELVGFSLLGSPYIPKVRDDLARTLKGAVPVIGGQTATGFVRTHGDSPADRSQLSRLFGAHAIYGNDDAELAAALGLDARAFPAQEETSLIPIYERIPDEDMAAYLGTEFGLYLSQGCKYPCSFCAAVKTFIDPVTGDQTTVKETYRNPDIVEGDLRYLFERAKGLGIHRLDTYLSNLDVFQTPGKLAEFAERVLRVRSEYPDMEFGMRGLATASEFLKVHQRKPNVIWRMKEAGFHTVGFGVDGANDEAFDKIRKKHNREHLNIKVVKIARQTYGLTPEALMVFGFNEVDEHPEYLEDSLILMQQLADEYGATPRPHVAKDIIPGAGGWRNPKNAQRVELLLQHPQFFQALDFTALPSTITHPNPAFRKALWDTYLRIAEVKQNRTKVTYPMDPEDSVEKQQEAMRRNLRQYDI